MMSELLTLLAPPRASTMLNPKCACAVSLDRCDPCDLLLGLPGLHRIPMARARIGFLLEVESCDPVLS